MKKELNQLGLSIKFNKKEFQKQLEAAIIQGYPLVEDIIKTRSENLSGDLFSPEDHWDTTNCDV